MTKKNDTKPVYASAKNVVLNAIIDGLYSFKKKSDALEVLQGVRKKFVLSKTSPEDVDDSLVMWIKAYDVNPDEKNYSGNFASIFVEQKEDKKWTIKARKVPTDLKHHPQRIYEKSQHPNWGHPILRVIKKGKPVAKVEPLQKQLQQLQEDYPTTSVPAAGKLYIMIYEKAKDKPKGGAVNRYVLEIKATDKDDGFYIDAYPNETPPKKGGGEKPEGRQEEKVAQGRFTTMVELGRAKKRPKPAPRPKPTE